MYSYQLLKTPGECAAGCGTTVVKRFVGHYYSEPMCDRCFEAAAPELAEAASASRPNGSVRLRLRSSATCANCGDHLPGRFAGYHMADPLCVSCLREHAAELAALLLLDEAALKAADGGQHARELLDVAVNYAKVLHRLDAEHPRNPPSEDPWWDS
ncbi:MAG: hypothetical protein GY719_06175 [bacterium]|nr:hypothetical protein [bacterium]